MAVSKDLAALAVQYLDEVLEDQEALGYSPDASEEARVEADKHTAEALRELAIGVHRRRAVAA